MIKRLFLCCVTTLFVSLANGQDLRVINIIVPFSAGSAQDIVARLISEPLGQALQARVLVVNKPGAGGTLAAAYVASSKTDGNTYLLASSSHHLAGALYPSLSYHPLDSFRNAGFIGYSDFVLITSESMGTPDLASFVNRVRSNPNGFNYASAGKGTSTHVGMLSFLKTANLQMTHIPFKGTGEVIHEVISGRIQAAFVSSLSIFSYRDDPRIKLLASSDAGRSEFLPHLSSISELGYPKFRWVVWAGLLAPSATPTEKLDEMSRAIHKVINDPNVKLRFNQLGFFPRVLPRSQFETVLKGDWQNTSELMTQFKNEPD